MGVGEMIKNALWSKGMSQKELAEKMNVTPQAVSKWISGDNQPSTDNLGMIGEILGIDLMREISKRRRHCFNKNMQHTELDKIYNYEQAKKEAVQLLNGTQIEGMYTHSVYVMLSWLVPAVIGLTHHQMVQAKFQNKPCDIGYENIIYNLEDFLDKSCPYKDHDLYENYLEYNFYLMGMDYFESVDDTDNEEVIGDNEFCRAAMDDWYRFKKALIKSPASPVYCELCVAIMEMVSKLETQLL